MVDNNWQIVRRMFVRTFGSASFLMPVAVGAASLGMASLLSAPPLSFFGIVGWGLVGLGFGRAIWRFTIGHRALAENSIRDVRRRVQRGHLDYLRSLRRRIRRDRDPRTSRIVIELQRIYERLCRLESPEPQSDTRILPALHDQAQQLYGSCLQSLERSYQLWNGARDMATPEARDRLLADRDRMVADVELSIQHLDASLDHLNTAVLRNDETDTTDQGRLREELEQGLEVARRVEERIDAIERNLGSREPT